MHIRRMAGRADMKGQDMKLRTLMLTSVGTMALATGAALAQIDTDALVEQYQSQGYTRVEVKVGPSQVKSSKNSIESGRVLSG